MVLHESDKTCNNGRRKDAVSKWPDWYSELTYFRKSSSARAGFQLINTLLPYFGLWYLMILSIQLRLPYTLTLVLALPAAAFLVRLFILFHDCVHGSFFMSKGANTFTGYLLGMLTFTSFDDWRFTHLRHHGRYANLDARGFGDIWTMTLTEYENASRKERFCYRLYRNPWILIGLGGLFIFLIGNRFPTKRVGKKERMGVIFTNLLIVAMALTAGNIMGWRTYLTIQLPVLWFAGAMGLWLFYVQHQFPGGYWARKKEWTPLQAAMDGSSFYKLPAMLRWFSGSIGYHHVHHLSPKIPNYNLKRCYDKVPALQERVPLTIVESLACVRLKIWNEELRTMTGFPCIKKNQIVF